MGQRVWSQWPTAQMAVSRFDSPARQQTQLLNQTETVFLGKCLWPMTNGNKTTLRCTNHL